MTNDSFFAVMLTSMIALFFGLVLTVAGYPFFLALLPVLGFIWGFGIGAQSMQALFGVGFLATMLSWIVGFMAAAMCAVLSYLFYFFRIGLVAFGLGYTLGVGVMGALGLDFGFLSWVVGVALGGLITFFTFKYNIQKYVVIAATSLLGAGVIVGTFVYLFGGTSAARLLDNPVRTTLESSPIWLLVYLGIAAVGMGVQYQASRRWEIEMRESLAPSPQPMPPSLAEPQAVAEQPLSPEQRIAS